MKRLILYISVPTLILFGTAYTFLSGGRIVETDNAYIHKGILNGTSRVSGQIISVHVKRNQHVKKGDLIAVLDDTDAQSKLEQARAALVSSYSFVEAIRGQYRKNLASLDKAKEKLAYETRELERAEKLAKDKNLSFANLDEQRHEVEEARHSITVLEEGIRMILSQIGNNPDLDSELHPRVVDAKAAVKLAEAAVEHHLVTVQEDGIITQMDIHPGEYVTAGYPLFGMTVENDLRIEANLKETELTHVKLGQTVDIVVDALPGSHFKGKIRSIDPATGAEFAVLPAQNATGNWVKVTQRVPVQIELDNGQDTTRLLSGLSVIVSIDTGYERTTDDLWHLIGL